MCFHIVLPPVEPLQMFWYGLCVLRWMDGWVLTNLEHVIRDLAYHISACHAYVLAACNHMSFGKLGDLSQIVVISSSFAQNFGILVLGYVYHDTLRSELMMFFSCDISFCGTIAHVLVCLNFTIHGLCVLRWMFTNFEHVIRNRAYLISACHAYVITHVIWQVWIIIAS